jgi:hydrogenase-4 membrane subunit HyfE
VKKLIWIIVVVAVLFFIVGVTIKAVAFLLWVAPVLLLAALLVFFLSRSGGKRIP